MIPKATIGPLAGHARLLLSIAALLAYEKACEEVPVTYSMGAKCPDDDLGDPHIHFTEIDCSGFVRAALAAATGGETIRAEMPDGSYCEGDWFREQGFKPTDYSNAALSDGHVRVALHRPGGRGGDDTGHIWLIYQGMSLESSGGVGVHRRAWDHQWFLDHVDECYVLA